MAVKNMQVNLQFNANVQNAKTQLRELQNQLSTLISNNATGTLGITPQIQEATRSAMDLKIALNNATNVNTGKLNLNKFQSELNRSGKSIQQYAQQLKTLGPAGVKAFTEVAHAVAQADTRLFSLQGGMKKLANTFMNTMRWQLTSQAIMAVTGAISSTVEYAKELDTSLNNIRIVTGKSADQMATFAKQANNAAKSLSTSTTKYTDASLIYYQQGLNDKAVKERTDVTVKLANVVGESAQTVSEWMTAIWNNFDDGSEKLEYYADVLAKLGAATASSADEIAGGLEKFAAVADTIGLSYEYAASALATITAETRQSEDVVGTALKTILSRMEQLEQGDTLEDGTTLGKYSLALQKVGVDIKNANGELKDMDIILQQTGNRWETLARDEQIALSQSVAGIRQYTQFMALMDNWDVMERNLQITEEANGALTEQQKIYEESTKAAEERMKVAKEAIMTTLLGGDDLTNLYNIGAGALEIINELLEAFGGLPTILLAVATALTKVYQPQIASFLSQAALAGKDLFTTLRHPIKAIKGENVSTGQQFRMDTVEAARSAMAETDPSGTGSVSSKLLMAEADARKAIIQNENQINASTKQRMEWQLELLKSKKEEVMVLEEVKQKSQEIYSQNVTKASEQGFGANNINALTAAGTNAGKLTGNASLLGAKLSQASKIGEMDSNTKTQLATGLDSNLTAMEQAASNLDIKLDEIAGNSFESIKQAIETLKNDGIVDIEELIRKFQELQNALNGSNGQTGIIDQALNKPKGAIGSEFLSEEVNKLSSVSGRNTNAETMSATLDQIDENKFGNTAKMSGMTNNPKEAKTAKEYLKSYKDRAKALADERKALKEQQQGLDKSSKKYQSLEKRLQKNKAATKQLGREVTNFRRNLNGATDAADNYTKTMDDVTDSAKKTAESTEIVNEGVDEVVEGFDNVGASAEKGGEGFTHWSDTAASVISGAAQLAMGFMMVTSAAEQMGRALNSENQSMTDWISNIGSMLMGMGRMIPQLITLSGWLSKVTKARLMDSAATKGGLITQLKKIIANKLEGQSIGKLIKEKIRGIGTSIAEFGTNIANIFSKGWTGLPEAAAALAGALPFLAMAGIAVAAGIGGASSAAKEAKQEEVSKGTESLEAIKENQELAESVTDLTEEYNALRNAGESTADVLEDMKDKVPELIENYKELAKTMGTHIDTSELEKAYEVFLKTGDTKLLEKAQENLDKETSTKEKTTAENTARKARELVLETASTGVGDGIEGDGQYVFEVEDAEDDAEIFEKNFGKYYKNNNGTTYDEEISFDSSNTGELIDVYNAMLKTRSDLEAKYSSEELEDLVYYQDLNDEIKEMSENMPDVINAQQALFDIEKEEKLLNEKEFAKDAELYNVNSVEEYEKEKENLIEKIQEETKWTKEQAEAYLEATNAYGGYAEAAKFFEEGGLGFNEDANEQTVKEIKEWFAKLPEEDRTLAMTIDYTSVASVEEAAAALEEARKKAEEATILQEAESLEVDASTFEAYTEGLADVNKELNENENLTKQIALNNLKISKGLETLTKSWDDNFEIINRGNKASLEYAEAIGEVKTAFEEMFGVKPSTDYIEKYSNEINEMVNGNFDSLQKLQDALAEDYILNMDIHQPRDEDYAFSVEQVRNTLTELMDSIDTSITLGEQTEISDEFYNQVQEMLDQGIITEQQLESMFRAKGYELEITGWKEMPGPEKTITRKIYHEDGSEDTEIIKESEALRVPIINGDDSKLVAGHVNGVATYTKSTDKRVIDTRAAEEKADKKQDRLDSLKNEKDRYHEINKIISDTERKLDKLSKAKDRAFGANKLALMDKEIAKQKELIKNNKELLKEAQNYLIQDKKNLISNTASNLTLRFDEEDRISNYESLQDSYIKRLKNAAGNEELYQDIEKEYEDFKDAADKYEETLDKVKDQQQAIIDQQYELQDLALEKIQYKIEFKIELSDNERELLELLMSDFEDNAFATAEKINIISKQTQTYVNDYNAVMENIAETQRAYDNGEISQEAYVEQMKENSSRLADIYTSLEENRKAVYEALTEEFEGWNEELDRLVSKIEFLGALLDNYKNIIDIVGKDMLGIDNTTIKEINQNRIDAANKVLKANKETMEVNKKTLENSKAAREEAAKKYGEDSKEVAEWDKIIKTQEEQVQESTEAFMSSWETALELSAEVFGETVNTIADTFSEQVSGIYDSIEEMSEGFERIEELAERYLQEYEKTYEISKLNRDINKSIDNTDNIQAQRELRDLQTEIYQMTANGQKLSKYDLEYLQKKYNLLVAEQALKDAQNAKSTVRLQRNSEGNYGYVYTADQNKIDEAEQKYEESLFNYQDFIYNMDLELTNFFISTQQKMEEEIRAAAELYGYGTQKFLEEVEKIEIKYKEDMDFVVNTYSNMVDRNIEINNRFNAGVAQTYNSTFLGQIQPDYEDFSELYEGTTQYCEEACEQLEEAVIQLESTFNDQFELAGYDMNNFKEAVDTAVNGGGGIKEALGDTSNAASDMAEAMDDALNGPSGAIAAVQTFETEFTESTKRIRNDIQKTIDKINKLLEKEAEKDGKDNDNTKPPKSINGNDSSNKPTSSDADNSNDSDLTYNKSGDGWYHRSQLYLPKQGHTVTGDRVQLNGYDRVVLDTELRSDGMYYKLENFGIGDTVKLKYNGVIGMDKKDGIAGTQIYLPTVTDTNVYKLVTKAPILDSYYEPSIKDMRYQVEAQKKNKKTKFWINGSDLEAYDTGGYTGSWGPEGRMAILHQKEIVLNASDTENFLTAIEIVRSIANQMNLNNQRLSDYAKTSTTIGNVSGDTLQQEVTIHAEFPGVSNHNEIEEAFGNLVNLAAQYTNRKF